MRITPSESSGTTIMAIATFFMAVATIWLSLETRGLKNIDIGPNISISNVSLQLINDAGNPFKERSWKEGELINTGAVESVKLRNALLVIKFSNTGKNSGYVKLVNIIEPDNNENKDYGDTFELVPGGNETGWLYPFDIFKYTDLKGSGFKNIDNKYIFEFYDSNLSLKERKEAYIRCTFNVVDLSGSTNFFCRPIGK